MMSEDQINEAFEALWKRKSLDHLSLSQLDELMEVIYIQKDLCEDTWEGGEEYDNLCDMERDLDSIIKSRS